jgi:phosphoglycolate phosphatase
VTPRSTIIFDLDGTLLDTLDDLSAAANAAISRHGLPTHTRDAYREFIGGGVENLIRQAIGAHADIERLTRVCLAEFQATYEQQWNVASKLYPGIPALLDELANRHCRLAILSNKPHEFTLKCVAHYFHNWAFSPVFGQREGIPKKPAPDAVHEIIQLLGCSPSDCLYVGDSCVDIETAKNSGVTAVGVAWGFRGPDELTAAGADIILQEPSELLEHCIANE